MTNLPGQWLQRQANGSKIYQLVLAPPGTSALMGQQWRQGARVISNAVIDRVLQEALRKLVRDSHSQATGSGVFSLLGYRGTSLIRNRFALGPYSRTMPRVLGGS